MRPSGTGRPADRPGAPACTDPAARHSAPAPEPLGQRGPSRPPSRCRHGAARETPLEGARTGSADRARPGAGHRGGEPEGRRRQDDVHDQPRRGARRVRPPGAPRRLRPAGRAVGRAGRAGPRARHHDLQPAHGARRRDRRRHPRDLASRAWTCCRATSTCPPPRCSSSRRSAASRRSAGRSSRCSTATTSILIDCQPSLGLLTINALACADAHPDPAGLRVLQPARRRAADGHDRQGAGSAQPRSARSSASWPRCSTRARCTRGRCASASSRRSATSCSTR